MPAFVDHLNRDIFLPGIPKRVISVVPSQTELLFYLGLDESITGITKFCTHPQEKVKSKIKVGGTKQLNIELIKELRPDLIIANKEENERSQIEELTQVCPVWISDINNLPDALRMIRSVGEMTGRITETQALNETIKLEFDKLNKAALKNLRAAYLIWRKPYMVAGRDTFIDSMLNACGLSNAFDTTRYPGVSTDMLKKAQPDVVLLSSEPYPFSDKHIREFEAMLPGAKVLLVDGEMFSWYGSRLLQAPDYFLSLIKSLV